jgi:hypothetical protein
MVDHGKQAPQPGADHVPSGQAVQGAAVPTVLSWLPLPAT